MIRLLEPICSLKIYSKNTKKTFKRAVAHVVQPAHYFNQFTKELIVGVGSIATVKLTVNLGVGGRTDFRAES